jgi:hypothetical protein
VNADNLSRFKTAAPLPLSSNYDCDGIAVTESPAVDIKKLLCPIFILSNEQNRLILAASCHHEVRRPKPTPPVYFPSIPTQALFSMWRAFLARFCSSSRFE